jgi:hypothetical protein
MGHASRALKPDQTLHQPGNVCALLHLHLNAEILRPIVEPPKQQSPWPMLLSLSLSLGTTSCIPAILPTF